MPNCPTYRLVFHIMQLPFASTTHPWLESADVDPFITKRVTPKDLSVLENRNENLFFREQKNAKAPDFDEAGSQCQNINSVIYQNITSPRKKIILSQKNKNIEEKSDVPLSKMVEEGNNLLKSIISSLTKENEYQMSDWEDDHAMKDEDIDQECDVFEGKKIPTWACVEPLKISIENQKQADGDKIFASLPRRCNLEAVFGTKCIPYYMKPKKIK